MKSLSNNYHDYVIKGGKFIGLFDEMYKYSKDIPWHQDEVAFKWFTQIGQFIVKDIVSERGQRFSKILEIGCGLGYIISQFKPYAEKLCGCDISPTALVKARKLHKSIKFFLWDVREAKIKRDNFDLIIMFEVMWYVLDSLENVKRNVYLLLPPGGYFLFKQSFPNLTKPYVGKEIFPNPQSMINFWSNFEMIYYCEIKDFLMEDGPLILLLGRKK